MESYNIWHSQTGSENRPTYIGGFNKFPHYSEAFTPNTDTPYSWTWLDLPADPIVISVPEVPMDRYYVLQFIDLFTYNNPPGCCPPTGRPKGAIHISRVLTPTCSTRLQSFPRQRGGRAGNSEGIRILPFSYVISLAWDRLLSKPLRSCIVTFIKIS
jgi:hypothetical protein